MELALTIVVGKEGESYPSVRQGWVDAHARFAIDALEPRPVDDRQPAAQRFRCSVRSYVERTPRERRV
jgi:hypothetical protein